MPRIPSETPKQVFGREPNTEYVVLWSRKDRKYYMGFGVANGGVRVDYHGDLEDLEVYDAFFETPSNPWSSDFIKLGRRSDLTPRYS